MDEIQRAAERLDGVRCVRYEDEDGAIRLGVLPDDARGAAPELVRGTGAVDYEGLTAVLVQAVRELKGMVLDLACILEVPPCENWPREQRVPE